MIEISTDNLNPQYYATFVNILEKATRQRLTLPEGMSREEFIGQSDWSYIATLIFRMIEPIILNSNIIAQLKSRQHLSRLFSELEKLPERGLNISIELPDGTQFQLNRQNAQQLLHAIQNYDKD